MRIMTDQEIRALVKTRLPKEAFMRSRWKLLYCLPLIVSIIALTAWVTVPDLPWAIRSLVCFVIGNVYIALMLLAHEVGHGAHTTNRKIRWLILFIGFLVYLIPPSLWVVWHNVAHHSHSNQPGIDPDNFDDQEASKRGILHKIGQVPIVKLLGGFFALTMQGQNVLWHLSFKKPNRRVFKLLRKRNAIIELALMFIIWISTARFLGVSGSLWGILLPMMIANAVIMSYVITNHLLCPFCNSSHSLVTTMSVRTWKIVDFCHLHFSHHTEHHIFPALSHRYYPEVRRILETEVGAAYKAPSHWRAVYVFLTMPRIWNGAEFVDASGTRRMNLAELNARLQI